MERPVIRMAAGASRFTELWKRAAKQIRGLVPFYKEANIGHRNVRDWMKLHLEEEWGRSMKALNIMFRVAKSPEFPFRGICFLMMGESLCHHAKYFHYMDCEHILTLKMGVSTNTGILVPGTNSEVTSTTDISTLTYDDLFFLIKKKIDYTNPVIYEKFTPLSCDAYSHVIDKDLWYEDEEDDLNEIRKKDSFLRWFTPPDNESEEMDDPCRGMTSQYQGLMTERPYDIRFKQVTILSYEPPFLTLKVESNGRFNSKVLVTYIKDVSGIDCCVTASDRVSYGPVRIQDCLVKHQMYFSELKESARTWTPILLKRMDDYKLKDKIKTERRLRF